MKKLLSTLLLALVSLTSQAQTKAHVDQKTKEFWLTANMRQDHEFFGYASASVGAKKLILFSVFTNAVKDNPYNCPLGAYYDTNGLKTNDKIVFVSADRAFVKLNYVSAAQEITPFYVQRRFVRIQ